MMMHCKIKMMFPHKIYAEYLQKERYLYFVHLGWTYFKACTHIIHYLVHQNKFLFMKTSVLYWANLKAGKKSLKIF